MGHPPSPPSSIDGLAQLEQYMNTTAATSLQLNTRAPSENLQNYAPAHQPRYQTAYHVDGFPTFQLSSGYPYQQQQDGHSPSIGYLGPEESAGGLYGTANGRASHYGYTHRPYTPETSPPARPTAEDLSITRRKRSIARRSSPAESRRAKRPRVEKKAGRPINEADSDYVDKPLSEMSKEMPDVIVYDVGTYAQRPVSVRQQEAAEQSKVKRPLNDFVLYRKAYIDVVKARFMLGEKTINQQRVSRICGDSWKMEVPEIKSKFKELSNMERDRHGQAFPEYKYAPKQGKKPKSEDAATPAQGKPRTKLSNRVASRRPATSSSSSRVRSRGQLGYEGFPRTAQAGALAEQQRSFGGDAYWCSPGIQPLFPGCGAGHSSAQAQIIYPGYHSMCPMVEFSYKMGEVIKEELPSAGSDMAHPVPPIDPNLEGFSDPCLELCIDPSLLPRLGESMYQCVPPGGHLKSHRGLRDGGEVMATMPDLDVDGAHNAYLKGGLDDWHIEHFDETSHFNDWMAQEEHTRI